MHYVQTFLMIWGILSLFSLAVFVFIWGPMTYRFFRDEVKLYPPNWLLRLRWELGYIRLFIRSNAQRVRGWFFVLTVLTLLLVSLIITA